MAGKTVTVRLPIEADRLVRVACGLARESKPAWLARVATEAARREIADHLSDLELPPPPPAPRRRLHR